MKAALLREYGTPLEIVDVVLAPLTPHQVRVRMVASGVCHSDLSVQQGKIPFPPPCVLGHEGAGVVEEVGDSVTLVAPGDHVVLSWVPACRDCVWCRADQPFLCQQGLGDALSAPYGTVAGETVFAGLTTGTFGESTQVLDKALVKIAPDTPFDVAALVGCAVTTGVGAVLNTAQVAPGDTVAVIGCGGVGLSVILGAVVAGASRIIAVDLSEERLEIAREMGASDTAQAPDQVAGLTGGIGVDHAFEVVGRASTIRAAFDMTRPGGTCTVVGVGAGDDYVRFDARELAISGRRILGCIYGSADPQRDFPKFLDLYRTGRLPIDRLITSRIGLADVNDAFRAMEAGEGARSLVML